MGLYRDRLLSLLLGEHSPTVISSGKSKGKGVLATQDDNYMYYHALDNSSYKKNKPADTFYMTCSMKVTPHSLFLNSKYTFLIMKAKTGCNARAIVKKVVVPGADGEEDTIEYRLASVATEQVSETF